MTARRMLPALLVAWLLMAAIPVDGEASPGPSQEVLTTDGLETYTPPLRHGGPFTENVGQWPSHVSFVARTSFGEAILGTDGVTYDLRTAEGGHRVKVSFDNGRSVKPVGMGGEGTRNNYLLGNDPAGWTTGARSYSEVLYEDVWPGVDVRYYFRGSDLKYDIIVDAFADPTPIRLGVDGHQGLEAGDDSLEILLSDGLTLRDQDLVAHYLDGEAVDISFTGDGSSYGFAVDKALGRALVIDPVVMHASTYLGGTHGEGAVNVMVDKEDNIVLIGWTGSADYPTTLGAYDTEIDNYDVIVTKMDHNCSRIIWSTYLGGTNTDWVNAVDVDEDNHLYIAGNTWSQDFPVTDGAYAEEANLGLSSNNIDIFITKMTPEGDEIEYSTFIGGTMVEIPYDMKIQDGVVGVGGMTISPDFPLVNGSHSANFGAAFILTMNENLSQMESCHIWDNIGSESVMSIGFDKNGDIALGGWTSSPVLPTTPGVFQPERVSGFCSFVGRYSPTTNTVLFFTFLSGGYFDHIMSLTVDDDLSIYLAGSTQAWGLIGFPTTEGAYDREYNGTQDGFVTKMAPNGTHLIFSTLLGGDGVETINDMAIDDEGNMVVVGITDSGENFPLTPDSHDTNFSGDSEGFITVLNDDATEILYSSLHGGTYDDDIAAVWVDEAENYVMVGTTDSNDLPVTTDGYQTRYAGGQDMFISVIGEHSPTSAPLSLVADGKEGYIDLRWSPPLDDGSYAIREYHLFRGMAEDELRPHEVLGDVNAFTDDDVEWGEYYYYAVYASNRKGMSPCSNVAFARAVTVPDPPVNMTAFADLDGVTLEWVPPQFTGGLPLSGFRIYRTAEGGPREPVATVGPEALTFQDLEAEDGTVYTYSATAFNEYGESRREAAVNVLTTAVPSPPLGLDHTYGEVFVRISWDRPLSDFGLTVIDYTVHRQIGDGPFEIRGVVTVPARAFVDTEVEVGIQYNYHVTARNAKGSSDPSETIGAMVMVRPDPPTAIEAVATENFVRITWAPPILDGASMVTGYNVYLTLPDGKAQRLGETNTGGIPDVQLAFLHDAPYDGVSRSYYVTAVNAEGESDPSDVASTKAFEAPGAPRDLGVVRGDGVLTLEWAAPDVDGGTEVLSYILYRRVGDGEFVELIVLPIGSHGHVDDDVENGVEYTYRITATNLVGESEPSLHVSVVPAGIPSPPGGVATEGSNGSVRITWIAPAMTGGLPISGYRVYTIAEGMQVRLLAEVGPDVREFIDDGLENGKAYLFTVRSFTEVGDSGLSDIVEGMPIGSPSEPSGVVAVWMEDHVYISWSPPLDDGGSPVTGYFLRRDDWEPGKWVQIQIINNTYQDTEVERGSTYNYTLRARNGVNGSPHVTVGITVPLEEEVPPEVPVTDYWPLVILLLALVVAVIVALIGAKRNRGGDEK